MPKGWMFTRAEKATVWFPRKGQGVLVSAFGDPWIITAAHCIRQKTVVRLMDRDRHPEKVRIKDTTFTAMPLAVELVSDIAILGAPEEPEFGNQADAFLRICDSIEPVPVCQREYKLGEEFPVHMWTHTGTWVTGTATSLGYQPRWMIEPDQELEGGTSGGPIINEDGELVGIIRNSFEFSYPALTLPTWVCRQLFRKACEDSASLSPTVSPKLGQT